MKFKRTFLQNNLVFFLLLIVVSSQSQIFLSGEEPAKIKWQQINTDNFQIVFPEGFEKQAQYMANALAQAYEYGRITLKSKPRKISVLLHNQSVISNGNAAWAPARINAYTLPPQDSYAENWLKQLAVHEFRHVVQIERMNTGLTKIFGLLFGQGAAVAMTGIYLPWWFIEGDAVVTETVLGNSGRGWLASFEMPVKAQLLEKGMYSYEKATHGSFRDYTPSYYNLGYQMVAYGRAKYGANMWDLAVENAARKPLFLTSFSSGIQKTTGKSKREFYEESMQFLIEKWRKIYEQTKTSNFSKLTKETNNYTNYLNPVFVSEEEFYAFKTGMDELTTIVKIDKNGNEKVVLTPGSSYLESLSAGGGFLCWAEVEPDVRWSNRSFSVIKLFNLQTHKKITLTTKSRYFSPQINRNGTKILAVEVTPDNNFFIIILNVTDGTVVKRIQFDDGAFMMNPAWSDDETKIVMTVLTEKGKNIRLLNLENGKSEDVLEFSFAEISKPQLVANHLYFVADYSGIDNLYAKDLNSGQITQVSSVKFGIGNYAFNLSKNRLVFSNYSSDGFALAVQAVDKSKEISLEHIQINKFSFVEDVKAQEKGMVEIDPANMKNYPVAKYKKSNKLFNFHSWAPVSIDFDDYSVQPGFMMMSQNLLSTAITTLGYQYDMDQKWGKYFVDFTYRGWYPIVDLKVEFEPRRDYIRYYDSAGRYVETRIFEVDQLEISLGASLPLNFFRNATISGMTPFVSFSNVSQFHPAGYPESLSENNYQKLSAGFNIYHYRKSSVRDLYPKWGAIGRFRYVNSSFTNLRKSDMLCLEGIFYVPGLAKHHGIRVYGGTQLRTVGTYNSDNVVPFIRGMSRPGLRDLYRFSADYKFPLWYPDIDMGSVVYLKRLTMSLFYDYAYGMSSNAESYYYSLGTQLNVQTHLLSFMAPVNWGLRYVYIPDLKDYSFNVFFSIDFSVLY